MSIRWAVSTDERQLIDEIAERAASLDAVDRTTVEMDVTACHANGRPLDLQRLLDFDDFSFRHDIFGINKHLDRTTGRLRDHFVPRSSQHSKEELMPPRQRQQTEQTPDEKPAPHSARPASSSPGRTTAERLRAPFPANTIGKLPRLTCKECIEGRGTCSRHQKAQCNVCHQWISTAHLHLDYVGHAAVTDRLLEVDPAWSWEPAYREVDPAVLAAACASGNPDVVRQVIENSPPLIERRDRFSGMWIRLTVDGTTRLGYATDDRGGVDANKILISDGIRNAAMRFGVGLDLWSKEDLQSGGEDDAPRDPEPGAPPASGRDWVAEGLLIDDVPTLLALGKEANEAGEFVGRVRGALLARRAELEKPAA